METAIQAFVEYEASKIQGTTEKVVLLLPSFPSTGAYPFMQEKEPAPEVKRDLPPERKYSDGTVTSYRDTTIDDTKLALLQTATLRIINKTGLPITHIRYRLVHIFYSKIALSL